MPREVWAEVVRDDPDRPQAKNGYLSQHNMFTTRTRPNLDTDRSLELSPEELCALYATMVTSRRIDEREASLNRQNKTFFQISSAGHEAVGASLARHLRPAEDWMFPYYRDRALTLSLGQTPLDHFLQAVGAAADPSSSGRQMPGHFGDPDLRMPTMSSPTGTQFLQAVGCAEAIVKIRRSPELAEGVPELLEDEIVVVCAGDGTTSQGEFWESLNTASNLRLPVLYVIEDNGYAISVPVEVQTAGGSISELVRSFPDLFVLECDGTDVIAAHDALGKAAAFVRAGEGPALVHAHCTRPHSHSMSDDEAAYRSAAELAEQAARDPIVRTRKLLVELGVRSEEGLEALEDEITENVDAAADQALAAPDPDPDEALEHLFAVSGAADSEEFDSGEPETDEGGKLLTMVDLINACLRDEMERDARVVIFGQDVADASREEALDEVPGKGGVFKVTHGLQRRFGRERCYNAPLAEANIVGRAIGQGLRGLRPVVEIQFFDYVWPAFHQIRNELATLRYRSGGRYSVPVVVRIPYGGYLRGGGIYHSQTGETLFAHTPGLRVAMPSNAEDANGLLRTAIRCEDPVIFLEHKHLYRQVHNKGRYPGPEHSIPFGRGRRVRVGSDLTVVACGALVKRSMDAARIAAERGVDVEVIDLRTIQPLDMEMVAASVRKTSRVLIAHEDSLTFGVGAEIAAQIADETFEWLDAPVRRIGSLDTWVAYSPVLEAAILPQVDDVLTAITDLAGY